MVSPEALSYRHEGVDRKEAMPAYTIVYRDVYSWDYFYSLMHDWLNDHGYADDDEDFEEILYEHLEHPDGAEIWVRWRLEKEPEFYKALYKYAVDVDFHVMGQKEVEIVSGGKKHKANKGEVEIVVSAWVVRDHEEKIKNHWLGKHFYDFIFDVFLKKKGKQHEKIVFNDMMRLNDAIRTYLKLDTYLPERELGEFYESARPE